MPKPGPVSIIQRRTPTARGGPGGGSAYDPDAMADPPVRFSVCIPSENDARHLGAAVTSVLSQEQPTLEVWLCDDASTDGTAAVVRSFDDPRVHLRVNRASVGYAANLDRAVRPSSGEWVVLLPPEGIMDPGSLATYDALAEITGGGSVLTARARRVNGEGRRVGSLGPDPLVWRGAPVNRPLSERIGRRVLELDAATLLERSVRTMRDPLNRIATAYPRSLYDRVGGYLGARTIHPEKWFHWRLLSVADRAFFVDDELFACRCTDACRAAVPGLGGALDVLVDDYVSSFELSAALLDRSGLDRRAVEQAFVEQDIARRGLVSLARGQRVQARRIRSFGLAAYPSHARRNPRWWLLRTLTSLGSVGEAAARAAYQRSSAGTELSGHDGNHRWQ